MDDRCTFKGSFGRPNEDLWCNMCAEKCSHYYKECHEVARELGKNRDAFAAVKYAIGYHRDGETVYKDCRGNLTTRKSEAKTYNRTAAYAIVKNYNKRTDHPRYRDKPEWKVYEVR